MEKYHLPSIETPNGKRYECPSCGYFTLEGPPGTFDICSVCFGEDDPLQHDEPSYSGGANHPSLEEARRNYQVFGAIETRVIPFVRPPTPDEIGPKPKK